MIRRIRIDHPQKSKDFALRLSRHYIGFYSSSVVLSMQPPMGFPQAQGQSIGRILCTFMFWATLLKFEKVFNMVEMEVLSVLPLFLQDSGDSARVQ